jgi:hypothetical protein
MTFKEYIINVLGTLTQGLNTLLGGNRDQSFSSRSYEAKQVGKWWGSTSVFLIELIFGKGHCERAFLSDTERTYSNAS